MARPRALFLLHLRRRMRKLGYMNSGVAVLQRFVVTQETDELWLVKDDRASSLYCYPTEAEARSAALALAKSATERGAAATVLIVPPKPDLRVQDGDAAKPPQFTGM
jgi:hypothetical protein